MLSLVCHIILFLAFFFFLKTETCFQIAPKLSKYSTSQRGMSLVGNEYDNFVGLRGTWSCFKSPIKMLLVGILEIVSLFPKLCTQMTNYMNLALYQLFPIRNINHKIWKKFFLLPPLFSIFIELLEKFYSLWLLRVKIQKLITFCFQYRLENGRKFSGI